MSSASTGALIGAAVCVGAAPYLARLTVSVPDPEVRGWWRGRPAGLARTSATALVGAGLGALAGATSDLTATLAPLLLLALVGTPLVVIDQQHHRLPNRLVFPLAVAAPVLATGVAAVDGHWLRLARAAGGAAAVLVVLFLPRLVTPGSFGYGDVKLGGILGGYLGWYGWLHVLYGLFAGFVFGGVLAVVLMAAGRADRKTAIPLGPSLLIGALVTLAFGLVPQTG